MTTILAHAEPLRSSWSALWGAAAIPAYMGYRYLRDRL